MRRVLQVAIALSAAWALAVMATGGIDARVGGLAVRSRDPFRALLVAAILVAVYAVAFRGAFAAHAERAATTWRRAAPFIAGAAALISAVTAVRFGCFSAGGSDAYGYVSQAYAWAHGQLPHPIPLPLALPWPASDRLLVPLGYRLGHEAHTMVPTYAPGLPLMMAISLAAGSIGPFLIAPAAAALLVWMTYALAKRTAGPAAGAVAAVMIASSPIVTYQSLWAMSDVPSAALWTGAMFASLGCSRRAALAAGACTAAALLVRPNLAPLAAVPFIAMLAHRGAPPRTRLARVVVFVAPIALVAAAVGALNVAWYGGVLQSGYGATGELYSAANVLPNLARYPNWFWQSQSPLVLFGFLPLVGVFRKGTSTAAIALAWAMVLVTLACYLPYGVFEEWWYLRFMLPGLGAAAVLISAGLVGLARVVPRPWGALLACVLLAVMVGYGLRFSSAHGSFGQVRDGERRYISVGTFVGQHLPDSALVFAMQHSGSIRFYGGRATLRYDFLDPARAETAARDLERAGYHPYLAIDDWEIDAVRQRFGLPPGAPPWSVAARMRELGGVTVYDLAPGASSGPVALEPGGAPLCPPPAPMRTAAATAGR